MSLTIQRQVAIDFYRIDYDKKWYLGMILCELEKKMIRLIK